MEKLPIYRQVGWDNNEFITVFKYSDSFAEGGDGNHRSFYIFGLISRIMLYFAGIRDIQIPGIQIFASDLNALPIFNVNVQVFSEGTPLSYRFQYCMYENNKVSEVF